MSTAGRLIAFVAVLALVFAGAALAGGAIDPRGEDKIADDGHGPDEMAADDATHGAPESGEHGAPAAQPVRGLAVADDGLRVVVDDPELRRGRDERLRFRIVDERGRTVRDFDVEHEKRMHLIVARRDLTGFQHLHPEQGADGTWSTAVSIPDAGSYRMFADFTRDGTAHTLAADLRVDGRADLQALPAAQTEAVSDGGYDVRLEAGNARRGEEAELRFAITKDGVPVRTDPYLGAGGHLVALREGDLAFLHVHPNEHGDGVGFEATFPTAGRYRLFLQFKHEGRVQTVAFTQEVR